MKEQEMYGTLTLTSHDIESIADDLYREGGSLHHLKDLRGIDCSHDLEDK